MNKEHVYKNLAEQVQKVLDEKGLKPADLAREMGVSQSYLTQFLKYGQKTPVERIQQMLDPLGYEIRVEKKTPQSPSVM